MDQEQAEDILRRAQVKKELQDSWLLVVLTVLAGARIPEEVMAGMGERWKNSAKKHEQHYADMGIDIEEVADSIFMNFKHGYLKARGKGKEKKKEPPKEQK